MVNVNCIQYGKKSKNRDNPQPSFYIFVKTKIEEGSETTWLWADNNFIGLRYSPAHSRECFILVYIISQVVYVYEIKIIIRSKCSRKWSKVRC